MRTYRSAEVANIIGIHPNTVRLYEKLGFIPNARRRNNQYRVFTEFHIAQLRLARIAFSVEVLQNGLRKKIVKMVKASAAGNFEEAIALIGEYLSRVRQERQNAEEAIEIVRQLLAGESAQDRQTLRRKEAADYLNLSVDTLRNWEMNGLLTVKRKENGYRVYTGEDLCRLKIIRSLRCANYSLAAILRLLQQLSVNPDVNIKAALNTPDPDDDIVSACDRLIVSLQVAEQNALIVLEMLRNFKIRF